jgi:hypothetical protein
MILLEVVLRRQETTEAVLARMVFKAFPWRLQLCRPVNPTQIDLSSSPWFFTKKNLSTGEVIGPMLSPADLMFPLAGWNWHLFGQVAGRS